MSARVGAGAYSASAVGAQHAEHAADLGQRRAARVRDGFERLLRLGRIGVDHVRADAGLHRDDAHRVRDHVVQLLGDVQPLVGDGPLRLFVALALERRGALFELLGVEPAVANGRAEQIGRGEEGEVQREAAVVEIGGDRAGDDERGRRSSRR